ncbi:hypothetical protein BJV74DRAFT_782486, partial [Russula compacta]
YPCTLVDWLILENKYDEDTGLWVVQPKFEGNRCHTIAISIFLMHLMCFALTLLIDI